MEGTSLGNSVGVCVIDEEEDEDDEDDAADAVDEDDPVRILRTFTVGSVVGVGVLGACVGASLGVSLGT